MSLPVESEGSEAAAVCAYLGLVDDGDLHATYATDAHRCYRLPNPTRVATQHQEQFCLTANHPSCPIYQGEGVEATTHPAASAAGGGEAEPDEATEDREFEPAAAAQSTPFATAASRWTSRGLRRPVLEGELSMRAATVSLFVLAAVVVVIAFVVNRQIGGDDPVPVVPVATETPTQAAATSTQATTATTATEETTPASTPTAAATPQPTAAPTEAPTQAPTEAPTGSGTIYIVQAGDSCGAIASANGVTLQELLDANEELEVTDDGGCPIFPDQELVIP